MPFVKYNPTREEPPRGANTSRSLDKIKLKPGINELSQANLSMLKEHPFFRKLKGYGAIELIAEEIAKKPKPILTGLTAKKAITLVDALQDVKELKKLLTEESQGNNRKGVIAAISDRLKLLTEGIKNVNPD